LRTRKSTCMVRKSKKMKSWPLMARVPDPPTPPPRNGGCSKTVGVVFYSSLRGLDAMPWVKHAYSHRWYASAGNPHPPPALSLSLLSFIQIRNNLLCKISHTSYLWSLLGIQDQNHNDIEPNLSKIWEGGIGRAMHASDHASAHAGRAPAQSCQAERCA
jgi:hypothetical protein